MEREFRAVIIGIEDYDDTENWRKLDGVRATAARVATALGTQPLLLPHGGRNDEAPRALREAIKAIPERSTLLLHWIGHGVTTGDNQHYLICKDSPGPDELDGFAAIPSGELGRIIAASKAERIVVILDTCFSGEGAGNLAQRYRDSLARQLDRDGWERVACVIASSHPLDKAVAGRFSQGMAEALEQPDRHLMWTRAEQYIDPERLALAVRGVLGEANKAVYPRYSKEGFGQDILPNPLFVAEAGNSDIETRSRLEGVFGDRAHFNMSPRGIDTGVVGYFFSGRRKIQERIIRWLGGSGPNLAIVTGPPGSGKSALIGRIVTLTVPEVRMAIAKVGGLAPGDPVPPENIVDVSIHAKGKTVFDVASAIGNAIGLSRRVVDQPGIADVLEAIDAAGKRQTIVIDALDEAVAGHADRIASELVRPLCAMAHVRLLLGTRRSLDGQLIPDGEARHSRLVTAFGSGALILDLEDEPETQADMASFVAKRLRAAPVETRGSESWIENAGGKVADAADGSFLFASLVARSLEGTPDAAVDPLPAGASEAFVQDVAGRFPEDVIRVTEMLRALAFGLGLGLSRAVWAPIATALGNAGVVYGDEDIVWMLRHVGSYIVETTVTTDGMGQAVYRLIHQALADHLQKQALYASTAIVETLIRGIEGEAWLRADAYVGRHLIDHARLADRETLGQVAAHVIGVPFDTMDPESRRGAELELARYSTLERLVINPGVLAISDPANVLASRPFLPSDRARHVVGLYMLAASDLAARAPIERWSSLHLVMQMQGEAELSEQFAPPASAPWRAEWARTRAVTPHLILRGHVGGVYEVVLGWVAGQRVLVSSGADGTVRLWDPETGAPRGVPFVGHDGPVLSVDLGRAAGRDVIVSGGEDGSVRMWDPVTATPIGQPIGRYESYVIAVACVTLDGREVVVSASGYGAIKIFDAVSGEPIGGLSGLNLDG
uniref:hypothetical protein n=1 Tax=Novosphingobium lentum TaxID=145287 RepID=UPI000A5390A3